MPHVQICQNATCTNMSKCHTCKYVIITHVQICQNATCTKISQNASCTKISQNASCTKISQNATMYKNIAKCHYVQKYRKMPLCTKVWQNVTMCVQNITKRHMYKISQNLTWTKLSQNDKSENTPRLDYHRWLKTCNMSFISDHNTYSFPDKKMANPSKCKSRL
jgi:hypothetical protein